MQIKKFAPSLNTYCYHSSVSSDITALRSSETVHGADVILLSTHMSDTGLLSESSFGSDRMLQFHRVIVDESHASTFKGYTDRAVLRWAVTGTPVSRSYEDLQKVSCWLGHWNVG